MINLNVRRSRIVSKNVKIGKKKFFKLHPKGKIIRLSRQWHRGKRITNIIWSEIVNAVWHIRGTYKKRGKKGLHPFWVEVIAVVPEGTSQSDVLSLAKETVDDYFDREGFWVPLEEWKIRFEELTSEDEKIEVVKWDHSLS